MLMLLEKERNQVVEYCRMMQSHQLTKGTGGNISVKNQERNLIAISPSGVEYSTMRPEDVVVLYPDGSKADGELRASTEWGMHLGILNKRPDIGAVVHTHSTFAVTLACAHLELPAVHYLIGYAGVGISKVPCIPYYPFGTKELAEAAGNKFAEVPNLMALLLGNHGLICGGGDINAAFNAAEEIEFVCELYYRQLTIGAELHLLSEEDMNIAAQCFAAYGQKK